ncbi:hypothetical protein MBLNU459_g7695t2 [Dothideomycetes sp. NU459]
MIAAETAAVATGATSPSFSDVFASFDGDVDEFLASVPDFDMDSFNMDSFNLDSFNMDSFSQVATNTDTAAAELPTSDSLFGISLPTVSAPTPAQPLEQLIVPPQPETSDIGSPELDSELSEPESAASLVNAAATAVEVSHAARLRPKPKSAGREGAKSRPRKRTNKTSAKFLSDIIKTRERRMEEQQARAKAARSARAKRRSGK